jgi:hypothetical protein
MVVDREALVSRTVVDPSRSDVEGVIRLVDQLESELAGSEEAVVLADHRIAPKETRARPGQPVAGEDDKIGPLKGIIGIAERLLVVTVGYRSSERYRY